MKINKKGFTLVELIAVITILCITITIVVVKVDKNINDANEFGYEMQIKTIEEAAKIYAETKKITELEEYSVTNIKLQTLTNEGLLTSKDIRKLNIASFVLVAKINNQLKVKYTNTSKNVIFLNGPTEVSYYVGDEYKEMGAYVAIPKTGVIKLEDSNIVSNVNAAQQGEYKVIYSYENTDSVERKVSVIN